MAHHRVKFIDNFGIMSLTSNGDIQQQKVQNINFKSLGSNKCLTSTSRQEISLICLSFITHPTCASSSSLENI